MADTTPTAEGSYERYRREVERLQAERDAARLFVDELQGLRDSLFIHLDSAEAERDALKAELAEARAAIERAERLRDKWLAWPEDDTHYAAGLMLDRHLSGKAFALDAPQSPEDARTGVSAEGDER